MDTKISPNKFLNCCKQSLNDFSQSSNKKSPDTSVQALKLLLYYRYNYAEQTRLRPRQQHVLLTKFKIMLQR